MNQLHSEKEVTELVCVSLRYWRKSKETKKLLWDLLFRKWAAAGIL